MEEMAAQPPRRDEDSANEATGQHRIPGLIQNWTTCCIFHPGSGLIKSSERAERDFVCRAQRDSSAWGQEQSGHESNGFRVGVGRYLSEILAFLLHLLPLPPVL